MNLGRRVSWIGLALPALVLGCATEGDLEFEIVRTVLESVAERAPETSSVCVATRHLFPGDSTHSKPLLERLRRAGWPIYEPFPGDDAVPNPAFPPDTGTAMIVFQPPRKTQQGWIVYASISESRLWRNTVSHTIYDWWHRVSCERGPREIQEVRDNGHGDGPSFSKEEFFRHERPRCGESPQAPGSVGG
jgi:hypothetical protein